MWSASCSTPSGRSGSRRPTSGARVCSSCWSRSASTRISCPRSRCGCPAASASASPPPPPRPRAGGAPPPPPPPPPPPRPPPRPDVIVLDEAVSALDVTIQAQILDLLAELQRASGVAYLFISHDLGVISHLSDRVLVMKDGVVVEEGSPDDVFERPAHPYTRALIAAIPEFDPAARAATTPESETAA